MPLIDPESFKEGDDVYRIILIKRLRQTRSTHDFLDLGRS